MARYGRDTQTRQISSNSNQIPIGILDNRFYQNPASGSNGQTYGNKCAEAIVRTDVTSKDIIWSKSVPSSFEEQSQTWDYSVPSKYQGGAGRFVEEPQCVSDTESEHSCSSADTMILLNGGGDHVQSSVQTLDTHRQFHPSASLNVAREVIPNRNDFGLPHSYNSRSRIPNEQLDYQTPVLQNRPGQVGPIQRGSQCANANRSNQGHGTSAPPGGDNHSDDGYESNDTNMSFETGSSGSLCSKDSGQAGSGDVNKPKSILKKCGQGESRPKERSVRFAGDGENDKHLESRTSHVPRQYVPSKADDVIPTVVAVKRTQEKADDKNTSVPSLEDRLKVLMVDEKDTETVLVDANGAFHPKPSQSGTDFSSNHHGYVTSTRQQQPVPNRTNQTPPDQRRAPSFAKPPTLSPIQEQSPLPPEGGPRGHFPTNDSRANGVPQQPGEYYTNSYDVVDNSDYISRDQVKMLMNAQSNLRRSGRGSEQPHLLADGRLRAHHSSMTNLPSQSHVPAAVSHMSHHASLMQLGPNSWNAQSSHVQNQNHGNQRVPLDVSASNASTRSWRDPETESAYQSVSGDLRSPDMSVSRDLRSLDMSVSGDLSLRSPDMSHSRQRHSYATYNDLTEMYKSMASGASGQIAPDRRRFSNSSEISLNSVSSVRSVDPASKAKVVFGTTADLYRMMKNQIRQPSQVRNSDNSIT